MYEENKHKTLFFPSFVISRQGLRDTYMLQILNKSSVKEMLPVSR